MENDEIKKNDKNNDEKNNTKNDSKNDNKNDSMENALSTIAQDNLNQHGEIIYIDENKSVKKKTSGDDVMLTQCILCLVLVLSVFLLKFIRADFQHKLLSIYSEKMNAPAEPFIIKIVEAVETWFKK